MLLAPDAPGFDVIAHRGASAHAPENTLASFDAALAQGTTHLELDVQLSRDREVVVFHDRDLAEKTGTPGAVGEHSWSALRRLDLAPWFRAEHPDAAPIAGETTLANLDAVFGRFGSAPRYHVELKGRDPALPGRVVELIREHGLRDRVRLTSFHLEQLLRAREAEPSVPLCWLLPRAGRMPVEGGAEARDTWRRARIEEAAELRIGQVGIPALEVDRELVVFAGERGVDVRAWRVPDLAALAAARDAGVSGATVDWPARALEWLESGDDASR